MIPLLETYDFEGAAPEVHAWHAYVLAGIGRESEARKILEQIAEDRQQWPHIRVRTLLAQGQAHIQLKQNGIAHTVLEEALQMAESNGFRYYQLVAHHHLCIVVDEESAASRHARVAKALARSLAANLDTKDSKNFLGRHWGTGT